MASDKVARNMELKKARILEAATSIFAEKGYESTTMGDIAKKAEVGFGTVATYFGSKEELFYTCVVQPWQPLIAELQTFNVSPISYRHEIEEMTKKHVTFFNEQKVYMHLIVQVNGQYEKFPTIFKHINQQTNELYESLIQLITNGQKKQQLLEGDPSIIAISYISLLFGLRLSYVDNPPEEMLQQFATIAMRLFGVK
ncbi:TetR/AcrR family transcriptional regulator [Metasolibacillus meyeri]|uniref:TetR/AcrR family transcriptional regulator n=1 Tax=Metasolibacillus meyeri TaxID=1071052 RepID=A0AAW9NVW2_9BACL|nr:TetR/AcrR family transcriptional regulator [Metasolibacillus meyeri]MEC1180756.1 TetR/AcrR family transcriptional regulator [Metasolibacillus meyeri]